MEIDQLDDKLKESRDVDKTITSNSTQIEANAANKTPSEMSQKINQIDLKLNAKLTKSMKRIKSKSAEFLDKPKKNSNVNDYTNQSSYLNWKEFQGYSGESDSEECDSDLSEPGEIQIVRI